MTKLRPLYDILNQSLPGGVTEGVRALNIQNYTESNIKLGLQHEGSTLLLSLAGTASNDTIFITGTSPVILKTRVIGYTGNGVSAFIYESPTYSGGSAAIYQNPNRINPVTGESQIIVNSSVTVDGALVFAPEHSLGSESQQNKGSSNNGIGQERILKPNTAYLFRLTSLDSQAQDVTSYLSWYEGAVDLPL